MTLTSLLKKAAITIFAFVATVFITPIFLARYWSKGILIYCTNQRSDKTAEAHRRTRKISIREALVLAEPYLQESLERIRKQRGSQYTTIHTYVILKGKWYLVFKDDYPWKVPVLEIPGKYDDLAIRINVDTGEVIRPKSS